MNLCSLAHMPPHLPPTDFQSLSVRGWDGKKTSLSRRSVVSSPSNKCERLVRSCSSLVRPMGTGRWRYGRCERYSFCMGAGGAIDGGRPTEQFFWGDHAAAPLHVYHSEAFDQEKLYTHNLDITIYSSYEMEISAPDQYSHMYYV